MKKILIIAANPRKDLNIDEEIRDLRRVVETSPQAEDWEVVDELAVRVSDLQELMFRHQPHIVHFCGHGGGAQGLVFNSDEGQEQLVGTEALSELFSLFASKCNIECVLLNACYSEKQARKIVTHINYAIGMNQEIRDDAAIAFSIGFYLALGYACGIEDAYKFGCNAIQLEISGSSQSRSMVAEPQRKLDVIDTFKNTAIPEHLKPRLFDNPSLSLPHVDRTISEEVRSEIHLGIDKRLEAGSKVKQNRRKNAPDDRTLQQFEFDVIIIDKNGDEISRTHKSAEFLSENLSDRIGLEMVKIPGGTYLMGSPDGQGNDNERPQHSVTISACFIGKYPITQAQWRAVAALTKVEIPLNPDPAFFKGEHLPVERISWHEAVEFCQRLSRLSGHYYRLPSEAEWEYACRAQTTTPFYVGETITTDLANYNGNFTYANEQPGEYRETTTPVDQFLPNANAFGLSDLHGNLWEWCADDWHPNYEQAPNDGSVWTQSDRQLPARIPRVVRGGAWNSQPKKCCCAFRNYIEEANITWKMVGFRIVSQI
jgi:formylglycine-generating enzyme required for sulfatase activity